MMSEKLDTEVVHRDDLSAAGYAEIVAAERLRSAGANVTVTRLLDVAPLLGVSMPTH